MRSVSTGGRRLTHAALAARQIHIESERSVSRPELASAARDAMKALNLRPSLRLILGELVGCWGETPIGDRLLVWPSNDYLVTRTGLSERTIRYGIHRLVQERLIAPRDSANGKRFAIKNGQGQVLDVFGFDLTPVYARRGEWVELLANNKRQRDRVRRCFDEITVCRRAAEQALSALALSFPGHAAGALEDQLRSLTDSTPRRSFSADQAVLDALLERYRAVRQASEQAFYEAGNGGNFSRHIETDNGPPSDSCNNSLQDEAEPVEESSKSVTKIDLRLILEACPALSATYDQPIRTPADLIEAGRYLRGSLGAHESAWLEAVNALGLVRAAITVAIVLQLHDDDTASGAGRIKNPGGYFRAMVRLIDNRKFDLETELIKLRRRHAT